jgi:hypothetical protein
MADSYNFEGFQIPHVGINGGMTGGVSAQGREFDARISNFGALVGGLRLSEDYSRTTLGFKDKGELENPVVSESYQDASFNKNPFVWGSTVKLMRNDELRIMGLGARVGDSSHDAPKADVMDTNLSVDDGSNAPKQFPAEGWHTFGGRKGGPFGYATPGYQVR